MKEIRYVMGKGAHLLGAVSEQSVCPEHLNGDGDRWFVVNSVGGATDVAELAAAQRVAEIQLTTSNVKLDVSVPQVATHSHVHSLAVFSQLSV